jgi:protein-disulfide isomerase
MENETNTTTTDVFAAKHKDNLSIPLAIVFSGILIAGAILFTEKSAVPLAPSEQIPARQQVGADSESAPIEILTLRDDDHILGNPKADVIIIEYSDAQCPFCQRFHETMIKVMNDYGKTGSVAWVYRHFPLDQIHPYARKAGEAMECAAEIGGNEGFWKFESALFSADTASVAPDALPALAKAAGIDAAKFSTCITSDKYAARVQKDFEDGVQIGVHGTPYSIIWNRKTNKQMPINGALPFDNVKTILSVVSASQDTKQ